MISLELGVDQPQRSVCFSQFGVEFDRLPRRFTCFGKRLARLGVSVIGHDGIAIGQTGVSNGESGIRFDGLLEVLDRLLHRLPGPSAPEVTTPEIQRVRCKIDGRALTGCGSCRSWFGWVENGSQLFSDVVCDSFLNRKHIGKRPIIALRPQMLLVRSVDQLNGNPHEVARLADASLQHAADPQFLPDLTHRNIRSLVGHHRRLGNHLQSGDFRQGVDQLLGHTVGEVRIIGIGADVDQREHGDAIHRGRRSGIGGRFLPRHHDSIHFHRLFDVLQRLAAQVLHLHVQLVPDMSVGGLREADTSRFRERLNARCDVDAVAEYILTPTDHITRVKPDPHQEPPVLSDVLIPLVKTFLDVHGTRDRLQHARELHQEPVAHGLDLASAVGRKQIADRVVVLRQKLQRYPFVPLNKTRIADNVGDHQRG